MNEGSANLAFTKEEIQRIVPTETADGEREHVFVLTSPQVMRCTNREQRALDFTPCAQVERSDDFTREKHISGNIVWLAVSEDDRRLQGIRTDGNIFRQPPTQVAEYARRSSWSWRTPDESRGRLRLCGSHRRCRESVSESALWRKQSGAARAAAMWRSGLAPRNRMLAVREISEPDLCRTPRMRRRALRIYIVRGEELCATGL